MFEILLDLWGFLRVRKKMWLLPIISLMLLLGLLILLGQNAALAPFVYTIF